MWPSWMCRWWLKSAWAITGNRLTKASWQAKEKRKRRPDGRLFLSSRAVCFHRLAAICLFLVGAYPVGQQLVVLGQNGIGGGADQIGVDGAHVTQNLQVQGTLLGRVQLTGL